MRCSAFNTVGGRVFLTVVVFRGASLITLNQQSLKKPSTYDAGIVASKKLLVFEVVSFSFFRFASLVTEGLKLAINLLNSKDVDEAFRVNQWSYTVFWKISCQNHMNEYLFKEAKPYFAELIELVKVELQEGSLDQFTHEMEPFLYKQGMPVRLNKDNISIDFPDDGAWKQFHKQLQHFPMPRGRHVVIVDRLDPRELKT
ncbi:unnamed protein product [Camellia sinensis]